MRQLQETEEGARLRNRLSRISLEGGYRVARAIKRSAKDQVHLMSVVAEIKRRTPTGAESPTEVAAISDVGLVARQVGNGILRKGGRANDDEQSIFDTYSFFLHMYSWLTAAQTSSL